MRANGILLPVVAGALLACMLANPSTARPSPAPSPTPSPASSDSCATCLVWFFYKEEDDFSGRPLYPDTPEVCARDRNAVDAWAGGLQSRYPGVFGGWTPAECGEVQVYTCVRLANATAGRTALRQQQRQYDGLRHVVWPDGCDTWDFGPYDSIEFYTSPEPTNPSAMYDDDTCSGSLRDGGGFCGADFAFPVCSCRKDPLALPFNVSVPEYDRDEWEYCFPIGTQPPSDPQAPCGRAAVLSKVEFSLYYESRFDIAEILIKLANGTQWSKSASWGPPGDNALKVTPLRWSTAFINANQPKICIRMRPEYDLEAIAPSWMYAHQWWIALFDESKKCCGMHQLDWLVDWRGS